MNRLREKRLILAALVAISVEGFLCLLYTLFGHFSFNGHSPSNEVGEFVAMIHLPSIFVAFLLVHHNMVVFACVVVGGTALQLFGTTWLTLFLLEKVSRFRPLPAR